MPLIAWILFAVCLGVVLIPGLLQAGKSGKSIAHFFTGNRKLPWYVAGLSMVATTFAADTPLAITGFIADSGISKNWVWWNYLAGGMLTVFVFASLWRRSGVLTENELITLRYSGRAARVLRGIKAVWLGGFMNVVIMGWVNLAFLKLIVTFFGLEQQQGIMILVIAMVGVAVFSTLAGLAGVAWSDMLQFGLAMTGSIALAAYVWSDVGGASEVTARLDAAGQSGILNFFPQIGSTDAGGLLQYVITLPAFVGFAAMAWWACWYPGTEPGGGGYVVQRMLSVPKPKDAVRATLLFQIMHYVVRPWPWIMVGLAAVVLYPGLDDPETGYVRAMVDYLPPALQGIMLAGLFAAYISTISTHLNWGASYIVNDLILQLKPQMSNRIQVAWARGANFIFLLLGLGICLIVGSIGDLWEFVMASGAGLGGVLIVRWLWWRVNVWAEITALLLPFPLLGLLIALNVPQDQHLVTLVPLCTLGWLLVCLLTPPESKATLERFTEKVRPPGFWGAYAKPSGMRLPILLTMWFVAVIGGYSALFAIGSWVLGDSQQAWILSAAAVAGLLIVMFLWKKSKINEN